MPVARIGTPPTVAERDNGAREQARPGRLPGSGNRHQIVGRVVPVHAGQHRFAGPVAAACHAGAQRGLVEQRLVGPVGNHEPTAIVEQRDRVAGSLTIGVEQVLQTATAVAELRPALGQLPRGVPLVDQGKSSLPDFLTCERLSEVEQSVLRCRTVADRASRFVGVRGEQGDDLYGAVCRAQPPDQLVASGAG